MDLTPWLGIVLGLGGCAGLFLGLRWETRLRDHRPPAGPQLPRPPAPARQPTAAPLIIGPSATLVVGPTDASPRVVGPALAIRVGPSSEEPVRVGPSHEPARVVGPAEPWVVEPPPRGAWDERGWTRRNDNGRTTYEGYYQIRDQRTQQWRRFAGRVMVGRGSTTSYIADPPPEVKHHPKGPCFMMTKAPWFQLNWHRPATNVDDAILYVEKILDEALNGRRT